jgi:hypothetical protein
MSLEIRVRYLWQSGDFKAQDNFFSKLIESAGFKISVIEDRGDFADLEIVSVFPPKFRKISATLKSIRDNYPYGVLDYELKAATFKYIERGNCKRRIWYSGENIRPPLMEDFDFFLSFDQDDYRGRNFYLPLYYQEIGLFNYENRVRVNTQVHQHSLTRVRQISARSKLACSFFSNPHPLRLEVIDSLKSLGEIDVFGKAVRNPVRYKDEVAKDYKYIVCFENDLFPGYITEKIIDAYRCGAIPLYWGDFGKDTNFNMESFFNLKDFDSISDLIDCIHNLSDSQYYEKQKLPLLKRYPDLSQIEAILTVF